MKISFHGAARTVTGSKHLLHLNNGKQVLLDCGMFQGMGRETIELNSNWGFDPAKVTYVILSHAHIDHVGLLAKLVKDGFKGKIFCTPQTADLAKILILDSAHIIEMDAAHVNKVRHKQNRPLIEPLYTEEDALKLMPMIVPVNYDEKYSIDKDIELLYTDCGHILGSAAVSLSIKEDSKTIHLTFSGDVGRYNDLILKSPEKFPQADYIIMESTYGNKLHDMQISSAEKLLKFVVDTCVNKKGNLIIPAFSVGRTQEILYLLNRLDLEKRLPAVDYFVDSPLSLKATDIIRHHPECFNDQVAQLLKKDDDVFDFPGLHHISTPDESMALAEHKTPCVIISASGMAEAGRIKHHIANNIGDKRNTILLVGYCSPHSLGARLRDRDRTVTIYGEQYDVIAETGHMDSMSAHGDYEDLLQWISCQDPQKVRRLFLVHGEYEQQVPFSERLMRKGFKNITIPAMHDEVDLDKQ